MRALAVVAALTVGCSFDPSGAASGGDGADAHATPEPDAPGPTDAAWPDAVPARHPCAAIDGELLACWAFDGDLHDGSGNGNDAIGTGYQLGPGVGGQALVTDAASDVAVAESESLDPRHRVTIDVWLRADELPLAGRAGIVDNEGQYGMFLYPGGYVHCRTGGLDLGASWPIAAGGWTHVACTYDQRGELRVYIGGDLAGAVPAQGALWTNNQAGTSIAGNNPFGDPFTGALDELRIWAIALPADDVCAAAGRETCSP